MDKKVASEWQTIKQMMDSEFPDDGVSISEVTSEILLKVIEYCKKHLQNSGSYGNSHTVTDGDNKTVSDGDNQTVSVGDNHTDLLAWDAEFIKVDGNTLYHLMMAANYLNIPGLLDLTCQRVADMMTGMSVDCMRETFNTINDYTPEEEAEMRRLNPWAFDS